MIAFYGRGTTKVDVIGDVRARSIFELVVGVEEQGASVGRDRGS
jgi:hypothetical protein